ncbi:MULTISPECIES: GTPase HflX [unclassified Sporosarcina]|uniref:GTPase HflX n=1 Tax=unclassified Sporosarcina TaxID=2647733 RepID=UPI000C16C35D|nr:MULTISPECIES: GTPase HflX [unclassified Sporosarcina]PID06147.1 GTPase HflX [Sporosarcina sp. P30]PID09341.1 GTPase HflX [Sporosarcina sp. P31]PID12640.1 GTPase HflX [Sporosarcina sp. P32b]
MDVLIEKAVVVGVHEQKDLHFEYAMEELKNLAEAINVEVIGEVTQNLERKNPSTYIGKGKIGEIREVYEETGANLLIFNDELSPSQLRNLERDLECKIIDRTMLILDIFARRARNREAQMQVELAQLQYTLPRLVGLRASLSRQGGGTGGGLQNKGAGETKLELDRRKIEDQIAKLRRELEHVSDQRETQRKQRVRSGIPVVSIVGYTNAGKSTLMNRLLQYTDVDESKEVSEKDMLFATLETAVRKIKLQDKKEFILTDTVGFVSKLPHHLVQAFRSTLEEAKNADLLLHVVDVSDEEHGHMMDVTNETLGDIGVKSIPTINIYNKSDLTEISYPRTKDQSIWMSAGENKGISELLTLIQQNLFRQYVTCKIMIPYDRGEIVAHLNENASIKDTAYEEEGTLMTVEMPESECERLQEFIMK